MPLAELPARGPSPGRRPPRQAPGCAVALLPLTQPLRAELGASLPLRGTQALAPVQPLTLLGWSLLPMGQTLDASWWAFGMEMAGVGCA